ncbi:MAG: cache domain-containing protein, partial [Candidatus Wildermuthbacteria bacterium]|nr:cache domain-containing protein [Candidatus Wildermuthbacteria bacterium]
MRIKLKTKLLVLALGSIFVSLGAALSPLILIFQNAQRGAALEGQMQIAGAAAEEISHFLDTQFLLLNEAVSLMSSGLAEDDAFRKAFMQRLLFRNDAFFDIALVDRDGNELIRENRYRIIKSSELVNRSQSLEFQSTKEHGYYSGLLYFEGGRPLFRLGRANKDANGKLVSMVIAEVDARIMQDVVRRTSIARAGGRAFIVDHNGIVIAHPVFSQVLAQKNFSFLPIVDALSAHQSFSSIYQNETGEKVLGAWADIMGRADGEDTATGWHIVAEENISYAMRHVDKALRFGLASLFFGFTLTFVGVWFLSRQ